jgi:succinoglycan biosynthesis transport protein ExoP
MTLRDSLSVLSRRLWTIVLVCVLVAGAAFVLSSAQTPIYRSEARLILGASQVTTDAGGFGQYIDPNRIETELQVIAGKPVGDIVKENLGYIPGIVGRAVGRTAVISLAASSASPREASDIANAYAQAYITYREQQVAAGLTLQTKELNRQITSLGEQIAAVEARPRAPNAPAPPELDALRAEQTAFRLKLQQVDSVDRVNGGAAAVLAPAVPATTPVSPTPVRTTLLGAFIGLVLGVGAAFLFEHLDDSVKTKDDVERKLPHVPVLGVLPLIPGWRNRTQTRLVAATDPTSPPAEAYRTLRTSIQFLSIDRAMRVVQVTSPVAAEGKSTTLANLAVTLSQAGLRVVVVCCDLRRPRIHEFFGLRNDVGFTSVLLGQVPLGRALQDVPSLGGLKVLTSGTLPPNPSELLSSKRTTDIFAQLGSQSDMVLVDCPPVLPVTDAAVLATKVDGTLVVASAGSTTYRDLTRTIQILSQVEAPLLGVVLNGGKAETHYDYQYRAVAAEPSTNGNGHKPVKSEDDGTRLIGRRRKVS